VGATGYFGCADNFSFLHASTASKRLFRR